MFAIRSWPANSTTTIAKKATTTSTTTSCLPLLLYARPMSHRTARGPIFNNTCCTLCAPHKTRGDLFRVYCGARADDFVIVIAVPCITRCRGPHTRYSVSQSGSGEPASERGKQEKTERETLILSHDLPYL